MMRQTAERIDEFLVAFYRTMPDGRQRTAYEHCYSAEQIKSFCHLHRLAERITSEPAKKDKGEAE